MDLATVIGIVGAIGFIVMAIDGHSGSYSSNTVRESFGEYIKEELIGLNPSLDRFYVVVSNRLQAQQKESF